MTLPFVMSPHELDVLFTLYTPNSPHVKPTNPEWFTTENVNLACQRLTDLGFVVIGGGQLHERHLAQSVVREIDIAVTADRERSGVPWMTFGEVKKTLTREAFNRCLLTVKLPEVGETMITYRTTGGDVLYVVERRRGHPPSPSLLQVIDLTKPITWVWSDAAVAKILLRLAIDINPLYQGVTVAMLESSVARFISIAVGSDPERFSDKTRHTIDDGDGLVLTFSTEQSHHGIPLTVSVTMNTNLMFGDIATRKDDGTRGWQGPVTARTLFREYADTPLKHETAVVRTTGDFEA